MRMPTKANYKAFDEIPGFWWEFFLTQKLGFKTREELSNTMSNREFAQWVMYYQREEQERELAQMKGGD